MSKFVFKHDDDDEEELQGQVCFVPDDDVDVDVDAEDESNPPASVEEYLKRVMKEARKIKDVGVGNYFISSQYYLGGTNIVLSLFC